MLLTKLKQLRDLRVVDALAFLLSLLGIVSAIVLAAYAGMKAIGAEGKSLTEMWPLARQHPWPLVAIAVMTLLTTLKPGAWLKARAAQRRRDEAHSHHLEAAIKEIIAQKSEKKPRWEKAREQLLMAANVHVANMLPEAFRSDVKVNLIDLLPDGKIRVLARSKPGSEVGVVYTPGKHWPVSQSIEKNQTAMYELKPEEGRNGEARPYKAIVATPITRGTSAYGAITVDTPHKKLFRKMEAKFDRVLRPYAQLMLFTLGNSPHAEKCPHRYDQ